jgi:hypothetical protein
MTTTATTTAAAPHISDIRVIMAEQLRALRNAAPEALESELKRSKAVSELSQTMINSAKVEIDYLAATKQSNSTFLQVPASAQTATPPPAAPQLQHNQGSASEEKAKLTRTTWVDVVSKGKDK